MTGSYGITDIADHPNRPQPGTDEFYDWLVETSPYPPGTPEFFAYANAMEGQRGGGADPLSQDYYQESPDYDPYSAAAYADPNNPLSQGKGRGGGIVAWIEERTGLDIDPEEFFTGGKTEEMLDAILENFSPDEQAWLATQGILVPDDGEDSLPTYSPYSPPVYGEGGGDYSYPIYYGNSGGGSGPTYQRSPMLGLVSWSI